MALWTDADLPSSDRLTYKAKRLTTSYAYSSKCLGLSEDNNQRDVSKSFLCHIFCDVEKLICAHDDMTTHNLNSRHVTFEFRKQLRLLIDLKMI